MAHFLAFSSTTLHGTIRQNPQTGWKSPKSGAQLGLSLEIGMECQLMPGSWWVRHDDKEQGREAFASHG